MKMQVFSVYDSKARAFALPFFCATKEVAIRGFAAGANDPSLQLFKHAEDFSLFHLGEFDDDTGRIVNLPQALPLGLAANFKGV